ncbi:MAG: hypothetical protein GYA58_03280 [Anaerolineaceae bacterium]|nr:hypothetical protein [Anaerolineaceae bacterium]
MSDNPLSGKVSLDTTDFKTAVNQLNREIRLVESGFRAAAAGLGDWANDANGLEMRIKALNETIGLQEQKVQALHNEYQRIAEEKGENSKAAQELEIRINRETESLNKMMGELGKTETSLQEMTQSSQEAGEKVDELGKQEEETAEASKNLGEGISGLGTTMKVGITAIAGLATVVAGVGAAIGKLVFDTASASAELVDLSAKTGISTERLQELSYVGDQVGTSSDTMTSSLARLIRSMGDAQEQTNDYNESLAKAGETGTDIELGPAAAAFKDLGLSATDANGKLRDSEEVFYDIVNALGDISNETERDRLALEIFGRSAMELNPLIKAGSDEIERLSEEAHAVGAVMSEETVAAMEAFDDQLSSIKAGLKGTLGELAGAFLPGFSGLASQVQGYMKELANVVSSANGDLGQMAKGVGGLVGKIATDLAQSAPEMLQAGLAVVQGIVQAIVDSLPALIPAVVAMVTSLVEFIIRNLPLMLRAGIDLLLALADGISEALPELMALVAEIIPEMVVALIDVLPQLIEAAIQIVLAIIEGLSVALPILIEYVPQIIEEIVKALVQALPLLATAAVEIVMALLKGIVGSLPTLGAVAIEIVDVLIRGLADLSGALIETGKNIVVGLWMGIQENAAWFRDQVNNFFEDIVGTAKNALGIHSPSTVFAWIGENMAAGLGEGFAAQFRDIERKISGAISSMAVDTGLSFGSLAGPARQSSQFNLGGINIVIHGNADRETVARGVQLGVIRGARSIGAA